MSSSTPITVDRDDCSVKNRVAEPSMSTLDITTPVNIVSCDEASATWNANDTRHSAHARAAKERLKILTCSECYTMNTDNKLDYELVDLITGSAICTHCSECVIHNRTHLECFRCTIHRHPNRCGSCYRAKPIVEGNYFSGDDPLKHKELLMKKAQEIGGRTGKIIKKKEKKLLSNKVFDMNMRLAVGMIDTLLENLIEQQEGPLSP